MFSKNSSSHNWLWAVMWKTLLQWDKIPNGGEFIEKFNHNKVHQIMSSRHVQLLDMMSFNGSISSLLLGQVIASLMNTCENRVKHQDNDSSFKYKFQQKMSCKKRKKFPCCKWLSSICFLNCVERKLIYSCTFYFSTEMGKVGETLPYETLGYVYPE